MKRKLQIGSLASVVVLSAYAVYAGAVNINPENPLQTLSGGTSAHRVGRGGGWGSVYSMCRSRARYNFGGGQISPAVGFRLYCPAEAK